MKDRERWEISFNSFMRIEIVAEAFSAKSVSIETRHACGSQ